MLMEFLKEVPDHHDAEARQYDLASVLLCTILAILSNAKNYKVEIRFIPRFLVEKEINGSASDFKKIFPDRWPEKAAVGIFWARGDWGDLCSCDYITTQDMNEVGNNNLYEKWRESRDSGSLDGSVTSCAHVFLFAL